MQSFNERDPIPFSVDTPSLNNNFLPVTGNDIDRLQNLRTKFKHNPAIGYLNINSLRGNKFQQLEQFSQMCELDILCIDETKLTPELPTAKFKLNGYQYPPLRRDRNSNKSNSYGGGKIVYIKEGSSAKD